MAERPRTRVVAPPRKPSTPEEALVEALRVIEAQTRRLAALEARVAALESP